MIITRHIDKWDVMRVLIDNSSQDEILFLSAFNQMGFDRKQLKEATKPLHDFGGKRIEPIGSIPLPVSFSSLQNAWTEFVTFDVVNMHYLYNTIFDRVLLDTFEATLHSTCLYLKVPTLLGVILDQGFAHGHRNVNCLQEAEGRGHQDMSTPKTKVSINSKAMIKPKCETKRVPMDRRVSDKTIMISQDLTSEEEIELPSFLDKNSDVFTWKTSDLIGVSRSTIKHKLHVNPSVKPKKQKLHKMLHENIAATKVEVQRLLDAGFIWEVQYPTWLANAVIVKNKNGK
jgi:hypothetical protein